MKTILLFLLLFAIGSSANSSEPRWFINQRTIIPYGGVKTRQLHIHGQLVMLQEQSLKLILNMGSLEMYFILPKHEVYWQGKVEEFSQGFATLTPQQIAEAVKQVPESQREMYKEFLLELSNQYMDDEDYAVSTQILKPNETERIAGYRSIKYRVMLDGEIVEDVYIAPSAKPGANFDLGKFYECLNKLAMPFTMSSYVFSAEYLNLLNTGYPMKTIKYNGYVSEINEVTELRKVTNYPSLFIPPSEYRRIALSEILLLQLKDGLEEDSEL